MIHPFRTTSAALALCFLCLNCLVLGQLAPACNNNTIWDILSQDPDLSIISAGTQSTNADIFLRSPDVNATVFVPTNLAAIRGIYEYAGITDTNKDFFGSGETVLLLVYGLSPSRLSPENMTSVPSVNTMLGMLNYTDYTITMSKNNDTNDYYVTGLAPNNIAKVLNVTQACNGYVYKMDALLQPSYLARKLPTRFGFGTQIIDIMYKQNCPIPLSEAVLQNVPQSQAWLDVWNTTQMVKLLDNTALSSTIFVPQNKGVVAAGNSSSTGINTADGVMYNMLSGDWCPEELVAAGTKNSMLGDVKGKDLPLKFSNDTETGDLLITGASGTARVLNISIACNSVIYTTDTPLQPPLEETSLALPKALPMVTQRHITCNPPLYGEIAVEAPDPSKNPAIPLEKAAEEAAKNSNSMNNGSGGNNTVIDSTNSTSSNNNVALGVGLGVGIGCAILVGGLAGFALAKRRRNKAGNDTTFKDDDSVGLSFTPMASSDQGSGAKLLPGQTTVDTSILSKKHSLNRPSYTQYQGSSGTGGTPTPSFAPVSEIFCDSSTPLVATGNNYNKPNSSTGAGSTGIQVNGASNTNNNTGSDVQMARLGMLPAAAGGKGGGAGGGGGSDVDLWEVNPSDLQIALDPSGNPVELGKGSYGTVYRGTIRQVQPAAIKVMNENLGIEASAAFWREAAILKHASRDRNVVQLYGTSTLPDGRFLLITELMELGDLRKALSSKKTAAELVWSRKGKSVALDIARGITALHAVNVIHRDLKSKNVLLTENLTAKVADVGIAGVHSQGYLTAGAGQVMGTLAWSAPELLLGERCNDKVDIYSLGIVLWEIATRGSVPQRGSVQPPPTSAHCPAELSLLIKDCINPDPSARPNAKQVYDRLLQIPQ